MDLVHKELFLSEKADLIQALETTTSIYVKNLINSRVAEINKWLALADSFDISDKPKVEPELNFNPDIVNHIIRKTIEMTVYIPNKYENVGLSEYSLCICRMGVEDIEEEMKIAQTQIDQVKNEILNIFLNKNSSFLKKKDFDKLIEAIAFNIRQNIWNRRN